MFGRQKQQLQQISKEDVLLKQQFIDTIDNVFETITGFLELIKNRDKYNHDDKFLLRMNEIVIQTLNVFGATCNKYKTNKNLMIIGREQYENNWSNLSNKDKQLAIQYGRYIECALSGKQKMTLYPLISKSKQEREKLINEKSVNETCSQLIGGYCITDKKSKKIREDFTNYGTKHENMYNSQKKKKKGQKYKQQQQPTAHEMLLVPGLNKNNIKFADKKNHDHGHNNRHNNRYNNDNNNNNDGHCCSEYKEENGVKKNSCIIRDITLNNDNNNDKPQLNLKAGFPVFIVKDNGSTKEIKFAYISKYGNISLDLPTNLLSDDISRIKQSERQHIMENGKLNYPSLLDKDEVDNLEKSHESMMSSIFTSFS